MGRSLREADMYMLIEQKGRMGARAVDLERD
jgi:hypothetical protein